ncbi:hypothetical protein Mapa_011396 [Marchantia paleacea]|nr:hypothetical protein Mapa_011396 [Marchantia paleacea]
MNNPKGLDSRLPSFALKSILNACTAAREHGEGMSCFDVLGFFSEGSSGCLKQQQQQKSHANLSKTGYKERS